MLRVQVGAFRDLLQCNSFKEVKSNMKILQAVLDFPGNPSWSIDAGKCFIACVSRPMVLLLMSRFIPGTLRVIYTERSKRLCARADYSKKHTKMF
jgi:hypothetical protein